MLSAVTELRIRWIEVGDSKFRNVLQHRLRFYTVVSIVAFASGCSAPTPIEKHPSVDASILAGPCAQLRLSLSNDSLVTSRAENLSLRFTLHNCGSSALPRLEDPRCGSGPNVFLDLGADEYALDSATVPAPRALNTTAFATMHGPCGIRDPSRDIKPNESVEYSSSWNGSLYELKCQQTTSAAGTASTCGEIQAPPRAGVWAIVVRFTASDSAAINDWTAKRTISVS